LASWTILLPLWRPQIFTAIQLLKTATFEESGRDGGHLAALFVKLSSIDFTSVVELHHFYAAPAPGKNLDVASVAPTSTLLYSKAKFLKRTIYIAENMN
jgi:hypothetical protein